MKASGESGGASESGVGRVVGAMWRHLRKAGRGEVTWLGDKASTAASMMEQYGEGSGRRLDRVATGRRESGRLPAGNFAPPYTIS